MRCVPLGENGLNAQMTQDPALWLGIIAAVSLQALRTATGTTDLAPHGRNRSQERQELRYVVGIRTRQNGRERDAASIRDQMMLAAGFSFIRGIRACFFPPCTARTELLSTTARDQSIWSAP